MVAKKSGGNYNRHLDLNVLGLAVVERRTVYFSGTVQGVGFRYSTCQAAGAFDVKGHVRNLADGRVELLAEGDSDEIDRFVEEVQRVMRRQIEAVESHHETIEVPEHTAFSIAR